VPIISGAMKEETNSILATNTNWQAVQAILPNGRNPQLTYSIIDQQFYLYYYKWNGTMYSLSRLSSTNLKTWDDGRELVAVSNPSNLQMISKVTTSTYLRGILQYNYMGRDMIQTIIHSSSQYLLGEAVNDSVSPSIFTADGVENETDIKIAYIDTNNQPNTRLVYRTVINDPLKTLDTILTAGFITNLQNGPAKVCFTNKYHTMYTESGDLVISASNDGIIWNLEYFSSIYVPHQFQIDTKSGVLTAILKDGGGEFWETEYISETWTDPQQISPDNGHSKEDVQFINFGDGNEIMTYSHQNTIYLALSESFDDKVFDDIFNRTDLEIKSTFDPRSTDPPITEPPNEPSLDTILIFLSIIGIVFLVLAGMVMRSRSGRPRTRPVKEEPVVESSEPSSVVLEETSVPMRFIYELDREVRTCCYQTARLKENYCWCGRALPDDLKGLFADL
jgi:hypothetical protein